MGKHDLQSVRVLELVHAFWQQQASSSSALQSPKSGCIRTWGMCVQAESLLCLKRPDEALKLAERGLEIRSTVLGARHADTGAALGQLASVLLQMGRCDTSQKTLP